MRRVHRARRTTIKRGWVEVMINRRELNLSDPDSEAMKTKVVNTRAELCQMLAEGLANRIRQLRRVPKGRHNAQPRQRNSGRIDEKFTTPG